MSTKNSKMGKVMFYSLNNFSVVNLTLGQYIYRWDVLFNGTDILALSKSMYIWSVYYPD